MVFENSNVKNSNNDDDEKFILLGHGGGGQLQEELIQYITKGAKLRQFNNGIGLDAFDDGATIPMKDSKDEIVITSDGHTISPIFFPGGDLGKLAACGTINDLLMMGARPIAISSTVFIEEGLSFNILDKVFKSFNDTLEKANVALLCGDTKVLPKGTLDKIIMATTGVGIRPKSRKIFDANLSVGDKIIMTGSIGDHGSALIANRKGINLQTDLKSDVSVLKTMIEKIVDYDGIKAMKDPTRGGVSSALNGWAQKNNCGIMINEDKLSIKKEVKAISEILGLDPLNISNEGKALIAVKADVAERILNLIQEDELGKDAEIIGEVTLENPQIVLMKTKFGGTRFIDMPIMEPIPRVC